VDCGEAQAARHWPPGSREPLSPIRMRQEAEICEILWRSEGPRPEQRRCHHRCHIDRREGVFVKTVPSTSSGPDCNIERSRITDVRGNIELDGSTACCSITRKSRSQEAGCESRGHCYPQRPDPGLKRVQGIVDGVQCMQIGR